MISATTVIMLIAAVVGWRAVGVKSAIAFIICGIFVASTGVGVMSKAGLLDVVVKGDQTVSTVTNIDGR